MPRYIAFLRAINVGGHTVKMDELRALFESLGFSKVETFIASGNVIFETKSGKTQALQTRIEKLLHQSLGYEVATFIRTDAEVAAIAHYKPFTDSALQSAGALNVAFLAEPLPGEAQKTLMRLKTDIDDFHAHGREVYWLCRKKQSESTFSNALFERTLKIQTTFRGFNTVLKLAAKYPSSLSQER
ncbi:MAG: DUF1697 domain-containing protein [Chloroflexi bacterium]|nr:DUF1697 domain-containing protein [Chloroflexota bacterium]